DLKALRKDFPTLDQTVNGVPLVYLDNAATSQKPLHVIETLDEYYREYNANIHRGIHTLSEKATAAYEEARVKVAKFINAPETAEVIFTRNTTEAINLVAQAWGRKFLKPGDVVLYTEMEHHSNLVPWHMLAQQIGVELRYIPVTEAGTLDLSNLDELLDGVKLVSFMHVSNVLGTVNPVKYITEAAHNVGAVVMIDGAQSVPNMPVDVQDLGVDFFAFSSHKVCGPTGMGVLWGKREILESMDPYMGGGDMIYEVFMDRSTYAEIPAKFEAGTPSIAQGIGLGAAVDYLAEIGMDKINAYEKELTDYGLEQLRGIDGLRIYGEADERVGALSFTIEGVHPHDLSTILDQQGVAIRAGHHCAQPLMRRYDIAATARASLYFYNTREDIDALVTALRKAKEIFGV
ncbi:MAG: cysteine desulfurase, partial [Chloroflexota bacterium]